MRRSPLHCSANGGPGTGVHNPDARSRYEADRAGKVDWMPIAAFFIGSVVFFGGGWGKVD